MPPAWPEQRGALFTQRWARAAQRRGKVRGAAQSSPVIVRARQLRRNATEAEKRLWAALRERLPSGKFRRQVPFGPYFADFASHSARLIVEIDGGQHEEAKDARRTAYLNAQGYRVIHFWNHDVMGNLEGVLTAIAAALPPHPPVADATGPALGEQRTTLFRPCRGHGRPNALSHKGRGK